MLSKNIGTWYVLDRNGIVKNVNGDYKSMGYGRRPRQPSQRKNWTQAFRMNDGILVYYGQRGGMYYFLCCAGHGHGFAYLADMIRAVNSHTHELGEYDGSS